MSAWGFESVRSACDGRWLVEPNAGAKAPSGASIDSRSLRPGQVFFALRGDRVDGHEYLGSALKNSASMAVVDDVRSLAGTARAEARGSEKLPLLAVDDVRVALGQIARAYRDSCAHLRVIGVTGSCGKTTAVRLVASVLGQSLRGSGSVKSFNNDLGVPLTLLNAGTDDDFVVCEIGSSGPGEIMHLCGIARPDIGVVTSIGRAHLEGFGSLEGVAREKAAMLRSVPADGLRLACAGSGELDRVLADLGVRAKRVGMDPEPKSDHYLTHIQSDAAGVAFMLDGEPFRVPLIGAHNALNAAYAVLIGGHLGLGDGAIRRGLASAEPPDMRMQVETIELPAGPVTVINDAYNANPESMGAALATLAAWAHAPRRVAILGDMLEQGDQSPALHAELVQSVRTNRAIALAVFVGAAMGEAAGAGSTVFTHLTDETSEQIARLIEPGDVVLLKGSRGIGVERVLAALRRRGSGMNR